VLKPVPRISVCICTYKRTEFLRRLLEKLERQETQGQFTYSIVVVDNDEARSAEALVLEFASKYPVQISYFMEAQQSIALARNKAVASGSGDFIAFIDDDEFPIERWLLTLFNACKQYNVDGVLGPVLPYFDIKPPNWVVEGKFYDRPTYPTGYVIDWRKGRTGNVLLKREILEGCTPLFRPEFRTGEDQDLFRRLILQGHVFVWCNEAVAYEVVPPVRWTRSFILRRAMLRGAIEPVQPTFGTSDVVRSIAGALAYAAALPVAFALGQGRFMTVLYKLTYHLGLLLALVGIQPVKEAYVTS
jgi:glycosyltransferase involved in cell wall biosynthesis